MFSIETSRNGKPNIVFKNHKYRESYSVKSGEVIWRCLGRSCGASIKTDADKTSVTVTHSKHTGPHPVTMRSLSSPSTHRNSSSSTSLSPAPTTTTSKQLRTPTSVERVAANAVSSAPVTSSPNILLPGVVDLVAENQRLNKRISQLNEQLKCVLDHSIESDTRLLQYTDQVFVAKASWTDSPARSFAPSQPIPTSAAGSLACTSAADTPVRTFVAESPVRASVADMTVPTSVDESPVRASAADCAVQCDLPTSCRDLRCAEVRDLVISLRTTIEVLEAELQYLKGGGKDNENGTEIGRGGEWKVCTTKRSVAVKLHNRFEVLSEQHEAGKPKLKPLSIIQHKINKKNIPSRVAKSSHVRPQKRPKVPLSFTSIDIEGDSHTRDLAGLVQHMVTGDTPVAGACRPGAKLLSAITKRQPTPGSCSVIVAGTNDIAANQQHNLYQHLEGCITGKLKTAKVVVSTLPHRHDLPASHPVNQETELMNAYIEEVCARHRGVEVLDFNQIKRGAFTKHGMHLKAKSKHLLAKLLVTCLQKLDQPATSVSPLSPHATCGSPLAEPPSPATTVITCERHPGQALPPDAATAACDLLPAQPLSATTTTCDTPAAQQLRDVASESSVTALPHTLPFDTFADAVKKSLPPQNIESQENNLNGQKNNLSIQTVPKG